jgi:hypothetical protein
LTAFALSTLKIVFCIFRLSLIGCVVELLALAMRGRSRARARTSEFAKRAKEISAGDFELFKSRAAFGAAAGRGKVGDNSVMVDGAGVVGVVVHVCGLQSVAISEV